MDEKRFGRQIALLRKEKGFTQDALAEKLCVSPQAVSKWENGHSLPETALLPALARLLDCGIDALFQQNDLMVLDARFGDGMYSANVTQRLNRLVEDDKLDFTVSPGLLGAGEDAGRVAYLVVKYQSVHGVCYAVACESEAIRLSGKDASTALPGEGLLILAGRYGTHAHSYDVMHKIEHYRAFHWNAYRADHETFPSDPANDDTEYLTLVYLNAQGIHMATCAEGESLCYREERTVLARQGKGGECFLSGVPMLPPFGDGMECSWAAALTVALQAMRVKTDYNEVMGVSGACYRLAFCSPGWDYSSVDGLVAYDYAAPGYQAYGYTPIMHGRVEKADRPAHRARILKELRNNMPVLGINLRVAPEWGVICGYTKDGEDLYCRTKYDKPTIENDPAFMKDHPTFVQDPVIPDNYLYVDNWPFLLCYFDGKRQPPTAADNLRASLKVFLDCAEKPQKSGYFLGMEAYATWAKDLRDEAFYATCDDEQMARRFSVDQFLTLSLLDARRAAHGYLSSCTGLLPDQDDERVRELARLFGEITDKVQGIHRMLDSGEYLDGPRARAFWTSEMRHTQAEALDEMARLEREALQIAAMVGSV